MASQRQEDERPQPRLYLVTPPIAEAGAIADELAAAMGAADIAAVLVCLDEDSENSQVKLIKAIAPVIQNAGAALILDNRADLVARSGADGAHLSGVDEFDASVGALKPDRIAGAGELSSKHDTMLVAEQGADYVMFGRPEADGDRPDFDDILDRVEWWSEVFQIPCVGFAASLGEVEPLVKAGAEFIALGDFVFDGSRPARDIVASAASLLARTETAK
jgi:thiamine-phosphate pyrophosphorylase